MEIREIKSDMQIIEVRRDDLVGKISDQAVAQGVLNIIKNKHHHADGSPVNLRVVSQTGGPNIADAAFRTHIEQPQRMESPSSSRSGSFTSPGIDSIANTFAQQSASAPQRQNVSVGSSAYRVGSGGGKSGGSSDAYQSGSAISGFHIGCDCGMEFTGTASKEQNMMVTGSKYNAGKEGGAESQYQGTDSADDWGTTYQSGSVDSSDAYQSGNDTYRG